MSMYKTSTDVLFRNEIMAYEEDEINKIETLRQLGNQAMIRGKYNEALSFYTRASAMDIDNDEIVMSQISALIHLARYYDAEWKIKILIEKIPHNSQINRLFGSLMLHLSKYGEALTYFIKAIFCSTSISEEDISNVVTATENLCGIQACESFKQLDIFQKLSEVGKWLLRKSYFTYCMSVVKICQNFMHEKKDALFLSVLLTEAEAQHGLGNAEAAIVTCQDCYSHAESLSNYEFKAQATMSIASLYRYLENAELSLVYYEKLNNLLKEATDKSVNDNLLLWSLEPEFGISKFDVIKSKVDSLINQLQNGCNENVLLVKVENRSLPTSTEELDYYKDTNFSYNANNFEENNESKFKNDIYTLVEGSNENQEHCTTEILRQLYHILFGQVNYILHKLPKDSHIYVIPDDVLINCSFGLLHNWHGQSLYENLRITVLSNLLHLDVILKNLHKDITGSVGISKIREDACYGGFRNEIGKIDDSCREKVVNIGSEGQQQIANPSLLKSINQPKSFDTAVSRKECRNLVAFGVDNIGVNEIKKKDRRCVEQTISSYEAIIHLVETPISFDHMNASLNTLTSKTATNTDIMSSRFIIPQFKQISCPNYSLVVGNPLLPKSVSIPGNVKIKTQMLKKAGAELERVASYLCTEPTVLNNATKKNFLERASMASVLHIATYGSIYQGYLLFTPNWMSSNGTYNMDTYMVTAEDILSLQMRAKVVVLSCGLGPKHHQKYDKRQSPHFLPDLFIMAGALSVVFIRWAIPNEVIDKFFYHFYLQLQNGSYVSTAVYKATESLKADDRYSEPVYWCPFVIYGYDPWVNLRELCHSQLDLKLDANEKSVEDVLNESFLNPKSSKSKYESKEKCLHLFQMYTSFLFEPTNSHKTLILHLTHLIEAAIKRLSERNAKIDTYLHPRLHNNERVKDILELMTFKFKNRGGQCPPFIVFPLWNINGLMSQYKDAFNAILDLHTNATLSHCLYVLLPLNQDTISALVDVFCIAKHSPELKLKVFDKPMKHLWINCKIKQLMSVLGFYQIGSLITFRYNSDNRTSLNSTLKFLLSISCCKSSQLFDKFDVNLLDGSEENQNSNKVNTPTECQEACSLCDDSSHPINKIVADPIQFPNKPFLYTSEIDDPNPASLSYKKQFPASLDGVEVPKYCRDHVVAR